MSRKIRSIWLFYRSFAFLSNLMTAVAVYMVYKVDVRTLGACLFLKFAVLGLVWLYKREYGYKRMYYFNNLGLTPKLLWSASVSFDLFIFLICVIITFQFL